VREADRNRPAEVAAPAQLVLAEGDPASEPGRVLIVDGDAEFAYSIGELVRERGYAAVACLSGAEALEALRERDTAVVVSSQHLPDLDGARLLRSLRELRPSPIGILLTEAASPSSDGALVEWAGAFGAIAKPFAPDALVSLLAKAVEVHSLHKDNEELRHSLAIQGLAILARDADQRALLGEVASIVARQIGADEVSIMLPTPDGQAVEVVVVHGERAGAVVGQRLSIDEGMIGWVARHHERLVFRGGPGRAYGAIDASTESYGAVLLPMVAAGSLVGVLSVGRTGRLDPFTPGQIEALARLAEVTAAVLGQFAMWRERERAITGLQESNRNLESALARVKQMTQQIIQQERLRALGQMADGIAHDLNNNLAMIVGFSELLLRRPEDLANPEKVRSNLQMIRSVADEAAKVVTRLRDFSRRREEDVILVPVDLNQLVERCVRLTEPRWRAQAHARGAAIRVETDLLPLPPVVGDATDLQNALVSLIDNAVDAMPRGGMLTVRSRLAAQYVRLEIADTGVGMSDDIRQRCFEPFFTTKGEQAAGLGLAVVYGTVLRHGGRIEVESALNQGTTFVVQLPVATSLPDAAPVPLPPVEPVRGQHRVLLVEDEAALRRILSEFLTIDRHVVETATNGQEGLDKFLANLARDDPNARFELVITDLAMPHLPGDRLAEAIKKASPNTPIILLTGLGEMLRASGEQPEGVDLVVAKPISIAALQKAIAQVFGSRAHVP
jgi:signal transduction histidine kinase/DNA-binding response OmpR family regulator